MDPERLASSGSHIFVVFLLIALCNSAFAESNINTSISSTSDKNNFYLALVPDRFIKSDDAGNDALSIQRSVTALCERSPPGGTLQFLARHYSFQSSVISTCPIHAEGMEWQEAPASTATASGTWFDIPRPGFIPWIVAGVGAKGTDFRDIAIAQVNQTPAVATGVWTPVPYPYVFELLGVGGYVGFKHMFFDGVFNGIYAVNSGRTEVDGLFGQFFNNAVFIDDDTDVSRIVDVHDWNYWTTDAPVLNWQQAHSYGMVFDRVDSPFVDRVFFYSVLAGIELGTSGAGVTTGMQIGSISCDSATYCIRIDGNHTNFQLGNMRDFGQQGVSSGTPAPGAAALYITGQGVFQISNLWSGAIDQALIVDTSATGCSNIMVDSIEADFTLSGQANVALLRAPTPCNGTVSFNALNIAYQPAVILRPSGQTLTAHSGPGATVFFPTPEMHN